MRHAHSLGNTEPVFDKIFPILLSNMRDFYPEILESRRQDLTPNAFIRSGSIYCMNTDILLKTKARYGKDNSAAYILQAGDVINIDEVNDLLMAETILKER